MAIEIIGTGRAIPPRRVTNQELPALLDTTDEWIRSHSGIGSRHIADEKTASSDLGAAAGMEALKWAIEKGTVQEKSPEELALTLDLIVLGSSTLDYYCCPSTACVVQHILGAKNAATMDVTVACSSFIYGLETAAALLRADSSRKRALVIGAEVLTRFANWEDRSTCVLFGDGSGAVLLEKTPDTADSSNNRGLLKTILGADGSGWDSLIVRRGGGRAPWKKGDPIDDGAFIAMRGQEVYNFAVGIMAEIIAKMMKEKNITADDLKFIVPHQANARIVQAAGKRLKIPLEKFYLNIEEYANTSSASIPIALDELNRSGAINKGDLIMTVGFGAGLTYGGNLIRW
ncbi:MAG: ketoacyl-ACP synthase III [Treponema sp.]|nr:ketoacyl-ACP synthase III [Treponema sp.]